MSASPSPRAHLFYSLLLILAVPAMLVGNTLLNARETTDILDRSLRQQIVVLANAVAPTVTSELSSPDQLSGSLHQILTSQPSIREITVYRYTGSSFVTVATTDSSKQLVTLNQVASNVAWQQGQPVANIDTVGTDHERVWSVVSPIKDGASNKVALLEAKVFTGDIDSLIQSNYTSSLFILIGEVILILILLLNYFRYVNFARMARQLHEADAIRRGFLNATSKGLLAPALALKNYSTALLNNPQAANTEQGKQSLNNLHTYATKLLNIVLGLSEYVRVLSNSFDLHLLPTTVNAILADVTRLLPQDAPVQVTLSNTNLPVTTDTEAVTQSLVNLLNMLLRYNPTGAIVIKDAQPTPSRSQTVLIEPAAIVIREGLQNTFFNPSPESSSEESDDYSDLGVVYLASSQLIRELGGKLRAEFSPVGKLSFRLTLPK
ncbi:hypothetical protein KGQ71_01425 [Patescibacteria group bacterium]|nr:hypothetical protein [Patescibacteria group bacterium]